MKRFLIIGNMNAVNYKEVFPLIKDNKMWIGQNAKAGTRKGNSLSFSVDDDELKQVAAWWYTNLDCPSHNEFIDLYKKYNPEEYPKYDNYDAIEVSKTCNIPEDYNGIIGVPISFLDKYCPEQFEIVDINPHFFFSDVKIKQLTLHNVNRKDPYSRILIKKI